MNPAELRGLLDSALVTPATRAALLGRLDGDAPAGEPWPFFTPAEGRTLTAVCARLLPPGSPVTLGNAVHQIGQRLLAGEGDGWRYDALPPDAESFRTSLAVLDAAGGTAFADLRSPEQDALLKVVSQRVGPAQRLARWFEDLLAELTELHVSHPLTQAALGYTGFADAAGWQAIGLNGRETWETLFDPARLPAPLARREDDAAAATRPPMRGYPEHEPVDAVVIGTGAGGGPLLMRLALAGRKVVALEAGRWWDPAREFATDERAQRGLYWNDERLSAGGDPLPFGNNNSGVGVGGSTLHYTAYTPRPQPDDFRLRTEFRVGRDWPLDYEDLEPYFEEIEQFLGVSGPSPYPWGPARRRGYVFPPLGLNAAARLMQRACAGLGIRTSPAPNAALAAPFFQPEVGWRPACSNRGFCQAGCSTGAKGSVDATFIPVAVAAGAEVRAQSFVTRIERDGHGAVSGVVYRAADGREHRQRTRTVFLCAGAVETPRLLLLNEGLANGSGQVGRNFMAHPGLQLWGRFEEETRPWKGIPGGLISEDTHRPADADFAGGYLLQSIGVMPVTYASQLARSKGAPWGAALGRHLAGYNHVAGINILGEGLPAPGNFLELSDEPDARGLPKPRVHFTAGENETRLAAHARRTMRAIWDAAGGRDLWELPRFAHTLGTCRMGADAGDSVVDADGRAWDVPGLFVCDNSVFPSALSVNPALTQMALSLRTADRFLRSR